MLFGMGISEMVTLTAVICLAGEALLAGGAIVAAVLILRAESRQRKEWR